MIFLFLGLFYEYKQPINQHFQIQNYYHFLIFSLLPDNYLKKIEKRLLIILSASLPNLVSSLSLCT